MGPVLMEVQKAELAEYSPHLVRFHAHSEWLKHVATDVNSLHVYKPMWDQS